MKSILTFLILFSCFLIPAQPPTKFYTKFGGDGVDIGYGVKTTLDKNYIVVGSTTSYGAGSTDVYLVKVDSMGWPRWQTTFGGFGNDVGRSVIQLQDSSFVIAGFTNSYGAGGYDALIIKTDKNGTLLWQKTFGGIDWDFTYDLVEASDGNIVVVGNTSSFGSGNRDGLILKYDAAGTLLWQKFYGGVEDDEFKSIIKTNDGSLATVGYNKSQGDLNGNTYFVKLDLNGDTIFTKTYGGIYVDYGTDVIQKFFNNYFISGAKTYSANGHTESVMYEISPTGTQVNEAHFYASNNADESWIALTNSFAGPNHTAYLRQVPVPSYKIQGNLFVCQASLYPYLVNSFGGIEDESFYGIDATTDGGYVSVGSTNSFGSLNGDVFLIKQDSSINSYQSVVGFADLKKVGEKVLLKNYGNVYEIQLLSEEYEEIVLTNIFGELIYKRLITGKNELISLNELPAGTYILNLRSKYTKSATFKLINI